MNVRVNRWAGEYEVTLSDKKKVYLTVYLKKDSAAALVKRLSALLEAEDKG